MVVLLMQSSVSPCRRKPSAHQGFAYVLTAMTAGQSMSGAQVIYRSVMAGPEWPRTFPTCSRRAPAAMARVANEWRRSCQCRSWIPAILSALRQTNLLYQHAERSLVVFSGAKRYSVPRGNQKSTTAAARGLSGISRPFPVFELLMCARPRRTVCREPFRLITLSKVRTSSARRFHCSSRRTPSAPLCWGGHRSFRLVLFY